MFGDIDGGFAYDIDGGEMYKLFGGGIKEE